jgi:hypothetical protein
MRELMMHGRRPSAKIDHMRLEVMQIIYTTISPVAARVVGSYVGVVLYRDVYNSTFRGR